MYSYNNDYERQDTLGCSVMFVLFLAPPTHAIFRFISAHVVTDLYT